MSAEQSFIQEEPADPTPSELTELGNILGSWRQNEAQIARAEEALKELQARKLALETVTLPNAMAAAGNATRLVLSDGTEISVSDELYASIAKANEAAAFAWLEANGHGDTIKDEMKIILGRGEEASARASGLIASCEALGVDAYSRKRAVHPGTLRALLREQLEKGVAVPKETFGVHQQKRAVIKAPK